MKKNVAGQKIGAQMITASDGTVFTGAVTVYVTGDAGTQAIGSVGAGACTHEGNGYHTYAPAQAETNYDLIAFTFIGTGAVAGTVQVYPSFPQTVDLSTGITAGTITTATNVTTVNGLAAGVITAASIAADAITDAKVASDVTIASVTGSVGSVTGAVGSVTGAVGSVTGNVGGNVVGSVASVTGAVGSVTGLTAATVHADLDDIQARLPAALTAGGNIKADTLAISGSTESADRLERSTLAIVTGTCTTGGSTTSVVVSATSPASTGNDQFNGRIITFDKDTTTAGLRGQATDITDYVHGTLTFTVTALTTAPASGDTFTIT